jgi:hypothetical protein
MNNSNNNNNKMGIGDWGLGPITNPQSPTPNPHFLKKFYQNFKFIIIQI